MEENGKATETEQPSGASPTEFSRPDWRGGSAFAKGLQTHPVVEAIKNALLTSTDEKSPLKHGTPEKDLERYFPSLQGDLRLIDFGHFWYWITMLVSMLVFLIIELFMLYYINEPSANLLKFQICLIVTLVLLVACLVLLFIASMKYSCSPSPPALFSWVGPKFFHVLPVCSVAICMVCIHFYVVSQTGYRSSPFLPALLASSLAVLGLPRENSRKVLLLSFLALFSGGYACFHSGPVTQQVAQSWGGETLANYLNILTFLYAGVTAVLLRNVANYRLG